MSEVAEIGELLRSHRFITLTGAGGVGKTRCAIRIAEEMLGVFEDGVWLAEFAAISDPALVGSVIANALNVQDSPSRRILDATVSYLKRKRLLLVLDSCEHVLDEARHAVAKILHECPDVRIIVTSRQSFGIAGEQAYRMPSLPVPATSDIMLTEEMSRYGAVQLFTDRAAAADNRFTLSAQSAPYIAEICRRLDGIPLAIELAAARVNVLSPSQLVHKLEERFRLLSSGDRNVLPRQRTMRALIDWSYDLLSDDERRVFRKLSIFAGGFTLELADEVCRDKTMDEISVIDHLTSLIDKSLVQGEQVGTERRYRLLESTRQYASEKLAEKGEYEGVARAHATAHVRLAEELDSTWETTPEYAWFGRAEPELENFRAAIGWALASRGDVLLGQRLTAALLAVSGFLAPAQGRRWVQQARDLITAETPTHVVADLDFAEASLAAAVTQFKASRICAEHALTRYREIAGPLQVARAQYLVGQALVFLGETEAGEIALRQALEAGRALRAPRLTGNALQTLGIARSSIGDVSGARSLYAEALAIFQAIGAERASATIEANLGEVEFRCGDAVEALRLAEESFASYQSFNDTRNVALSLSNIASYLTALERYDEARLFSRSSIAMARDAQYEACVVWGLQHLAAISALRDDDRIRAAHLLGYVDARLRALGSLREYTEQHERDAIVAHLRDTLGEGRMMNLMQDGSTWTEDGAVSEAMLV